MSIKRALAAGIILEKEKKELVESLASNIGENFSLLANQEPMVALDILKQLNEQFNEEIANDLALSAKKSFDKLAEKINVNLDELEY